MELYTDLFVHLKMNAERYIGDSTSGSPPIALSVPAYFNQTQRDALKEAAKQAGFTARRVIDEPTAALITLAHDYGLEDKVYTVVDISGDTIDTTIVESDAGVYEILQTDSQLVSYVKQFTSSLRTEIERVIMEVLSIDDSTNFKKEDHNTIDRYVEMLKKSLTINRSEMTDIEIMGKRIVLPLNQTLLHEMSDRLFIAIPQHVQSVIEGYINSTTGQYNLSQIPEIILLGGAAYTPYITNYFRKFYQDLFHTNDTDGVIYDFTQMVPKVPDPVPIEYAVVNGLAVDAAILADDEDVEFWDNPGCFLPISLSSVGVELAGGIMHDIVGRNWVVPTRKSVFLTTAVDNQTVMDINLCKWYILLS